MLVRNNFLLIHCFLGLLCLPILRIQQERLCLQPSFFQWQLQQKPHNTHVSWDLIPHDLHFSYFITSISLKYSCVRIILVHYYCHRTTNHYRYIVHYGIGTKKGLFSVYETNTLYIRPLAYLLNFATYSPLNHYHH